MSSEAKWPLESLSRAELVGALRAIEVPPESLAPFDTPPVDQADLPDSAASLPAFLQAAATPEQRAALIESLKPWGNAELSYHDLTNWAIRADLLGLANVAPKDAQALAEAGIAGRRDLLAVLADSGRKRALKESLPEVNLEGITEKQAASKPRLVSDTAAILVVKGAGVQKPDDTLALFLKGFWPAITALDPQATIAQRDDIFAGYQAPPHAEEAHNHVCEIQTRERRIWIKEAYWESELAPPNPVKALLDEWRMATYVLSGMVEDFFVGRDSQRRRDPAMHTRWRYIDIMALTHFMVVWAGLFFAFGPGEAISLTAALAKSASLAALISVVLAIQPGLAYLRFRKTKEDEPQKRLPGISGWIALLLMSAFLFSPANYAAYLLFLALVLSLFLVSRHLAWPYRRFANSDTDTAEYYRYPYKTGTRIGRKDRPFTKSTQLVYRYLIVLSLPVTFPLVFLARVFEWMPGLKTVGEKMAALLNIVFSNVLGDVVTYAGDPSQAYRVRSVVTNDIEFFHQREDVSAIHVFAHSQGTPITFETIFNHLPQGLRGKIKSYLTIGSVLSYVMQANPVLDEIYHARFPNFPYPDDFHLQFKWINCWNLFDPITEFYPLDEFNQMVKAPERGKEHPNFETDFQRHRASPTNIRTRGAWLPWKTHFEYWGNLDEVQIPFARRVLNELKPPEWNPKRDMKESRRSHSWHLIFWGLAILAAAALAWLALSSVWNLFLGEWFETINQTIVQPALAAFPQLGLEEAQGEDGSETIQAGLEALNAVQTWWLSKPGGALREFIVHLLIGLMLALKGLPSIFELRNGD